MQTGISQILKGLILLWYGAIVDIPAGWGLCDGTNGTPNLTDRFIVGAGSSYNPDDTGGSVNHSHTGTTDGHTHTMVDFQARYLSGAEEQKRDPMTNTDTFTSDNADSRPPYYSLAYIMKL